MPFRQIDVPSLDRRLSNVMGCLSSARPESHEAGLEAYHRLGGNCLHLHGEGGETHSRVAAGRWLRERGLRSEFFVCCQICHEGWDEAARRSIERTTPEMLAEDITTDLNLLETDYLDLIYVAHVPEDLGGFIDALATEMKRQRVRAFGVRNWPPKAIRSAHAKLLDRTGRGLAAVVTTELSLLKPSRPLWPEDIPLSTLVHHVHGLHLPVFAHADSFNQGFCLFDNETAAAKTRWDERWDKHTNLALIKQVKEFGAKHALSPEEVLLSWLLNRPFPVVALVSLPSLSAAEANFEKASQARVEFCYLGF